MSRHEHVLAELLSYTAADAAEESHRSAMVNLLTEDGAFSRAHYVPGHFTASCYVVDGGGRLLLHHHRRLDRWLQMGGHVEEGESPGLAALREGAEESGLRDLRLCGGIFDLDVHSIPAAKGEPQHHHFDIRYVARTDAPETITLDRRESNELGWFTLDRAAALLSGPESLRVIRKIRERSLA